MAVQNNLVKQGAKPKFTAVINSDGYKRMINNTLGNPQKAARFVTAITSAVSTNPALAECDASTIVSAGLLGEGLNLSPSPQLGQYYLVPFNDNKNKRKVAQFQLGYKGYIQLAIRSGQYKKLNVLPIKEGELVSFNPMDEEIVVNLIEDESVRENAETIGYYAMFEYTNGFKKAMYWSRAKMESHATKYSAGYKAHKGYTFWEKDFDAMACKTMLRQLISKWGIMSIELQKALENDMGVINENGSVEYVDTPAEEFEAVQQPEVVEAQAEEVPQEQAPADDFADLMNG
ncbi:MAG: recombinase RecT [Ruminococcus sp.]|nr:recombinase RecT [Ruminococcus sp.]